MSFDSSDHDSGVISQINVTPLVDVMLVLLVIFMVAAPILQQGVELELPQATIDPIEGDGEQLVVSIDKESKVYLGEGNLIEIKDLGTKAQAVLSTKKDKQVFVRADHRVPYGTVMDVMASLRKSGIYKVGLITEPT